MLLFCYGSNLLTERLERRGVTPRPAGVGSVRGRSLRFHKRGRDGSGKCDAFATDRAGDEVWGVLSEVDEREAEALAEFEIGYELVPLDVDRASGPIEASAFIACSDHVDAGLEPFLWYRRLVHFGACRCALPPEYIESIARVKARPDPDVGRARRHAALLISAAETRRVRR